MVAILKMAAKGPCLLILVSSIVPFLILPELVFD